jgi:hypothetical protein
MNSQQIQRQFAIFYMKMWYGLADAARNKKVSLKWKTRGLVAHDRVIDGRKP